MGWGVDGSRMLLPTRPPRYCDPASLVVFVFVFTAVLTLEHAVAVKLVHDERSVDVSGLLDLVGDDATDEVRMSRVQVGHQLHQGLSVR